MVFNIVIREQGSQNEGRRSQSAQLNLERGFRGSNAVIFWVGRKHSDVTSRSYPVELFEGSLQHPSD
jgi:hypothetical protein